MKEYVLADPTGGFFYSYPKSHYHPKTIFWGEGQELELFSSNGAKWLYSPKKIKEIVAVYEGKVITHYELPPEWGATEENPRTLTPEQRMVHTSDVYKPIYKTEEVIDRYPVPETELVGSVDYELPEKTSWKATLPFELREREEYRHLFPGILYNTADSIAAHLSSIKDVSAYNHSHWSVSKQFWNPPPPRPKIGRGSRTKSKQTYKSCNIPIPRPPYSIQADNLAEALKVYDKIIKEAEAMIDSLHKCDSCSGTGFLA